MNVAVIEVGSRSVRLLVAKIGADQLVPIATDVDDLDLMRMIGQGNDLAAVDALQRILLKFEAKALASGATKLTIFGTEAARQIRQRFGSSVLPKVIVLSPEEEAQCSLASATLHMNKIPVGAPVCTIDHGNGSLEIAYGFAHRPTEMSSFLSLPLGSERLLTELLKCGSEVAKFRNWVNEEVDAAGLLKTPVNSVIIQGSVATKCAWLTLRRDKSDRYSAKRVHGETMNVTGLGNLTSWVEKRPPSSWSSISKVINPHEKPGDQIERLLTGCILLERLMSRIGQDRFVVGAYGTRYGLAWRLAQSEPGGGDKG